MEELDIEREMFLSISYDRTQQVPMFTYCPIGGMPFEDIEKLHGSKIKKIFLDIERGVDLPLLSHVANELDISETRSQIVFLMKHLYDCFIQRDALLIEINPLVLTKDK